jgi:hypothetical protein
LASNVGSNSENGPSGSGVLSITVIVSRTAGVSALTFPAYAPFLDKPSVTVGSETVGLARVDVALARRLL